MGQTPHITDERLDKIGAELVRACSASAEEVEQAAASPFLYRRIQAHIAAEQRRRQGCINTVAIQRCQAPQARHRKAKELLVVAIAPHRKRPQYWAARVE